MVSYLTFFGALFVASITFLLIKQTEFLWRCSSDQSNDKIQPIQRLKRRRIVTIEALGIIVG